jgi:Xaa-Pro aminopeptidase
VTRTIHLGGEPTAFQKNVYTRVLKGNIAIDSRVFPEGTQGVMLDAYAREHLWSIGKDFIHGVGHGVGSALNVHEGPHSISRVLNPQALQPGMIISNEPGYYEEGNFGIRIENLLICVLQPQLGTFAGKSFLGFEKLTMIPIQKDLIDYSLLTAAEVDWINQYHSTVKQRIFPLLRTERAKKWLDGATKPI